MNVRAAAANLAWLAGCAPAYVRFRRALQAPGVVQRELLRKLIERNARCAFGRAHRFETIGSAEEFLRRVPLSGYDDVAPWIERVRAGEDAVLTSDRVTRLVPTSGSSGARKLIPFTAGLQREFGAAIGAWMFDLARSQPGIAGGPAYWSVTPGGTGAEGWGEGSEGRSGVGASAVPIGFDDDSEYVGAWAKRWVERAMAAPSALRLIEEVEAFRYVVVLCLLRQPELRLISVWHPSFLALLMDGMASAWGDLLVDVRDGGCRIWRELPGVVRAGLRLPALPARAAWLDRCDPRRAEKIWPALRVVSCWGDGHAALAMEELKKRFPGVAVQGKGLLATEAVVTIPFAGKHPVAVTSHFFEFIDEAGDAVEVESLRAGQVCSVAVTTGGGLWRYRLGDRVEIDGWVGRTPSLRFLGREGGVSDRRGEKLSESFVARVIAEACGDSGGVLRFAMLAPEESDGGCGYTCFVEGVVARGLAGMIDEKLCENPHYAHCRRLGQLKPLKIFEIAEGGYETFFAAEFERGRRLGEIKPCALSLREDWAGRFRGAPRE